MIKINEKDDDLMVSRNLCEKCLNFMKIEKKGEEYHLICPFCNRDKAKEE